MLENVTSSIHNEGSKQSVHMKKMFINRALITNILNSTEREKHLNFLNINGKFGLNARKPVLGGGGGGCEQHGLRPARASVKTDQRLSYSRFGKYHI